MRREPFSVGNPCHQKEASSKLALLFDPVEQGRNKIPTFSTGNQKNYTYPAYQSVGRRSMYVGTARVKSHVIRGQNHPNSARKPS